MSIPERTAHISYHDWQLGLTFQWDGESQVMHLFDLHNARIEDVPLQGALFEKSLSGILRWFESVCMAHVRMRTEAGEEVVQGAVVGREASGE